MRFIVGIDEVGRAARRRASSHSFVVGIDEVGRGSLAGPVTVAAVAVPKNLEFRIENLGKLRDSKKLSPKQRGAWFEYFKSHPKTEYAIARVFPRQIEKLNIAKAANLAAERAYKRLLRRRRASGVKFRVFLDGGLYLGNERGPSRTSRGLTRTRFKNGTVAVTVPHGDERVQAVAAASIVAKVTRDRAMARLARQYPQYGFEFHKGYGTKAHMRAIRRCGPSKIHRLTFLS